VSNKCRISSSTAGPENPSQFTGIHAFRHIPGGSGHGPTQGAIRELPLFEPEFGGSLSLSFILLFIPMSGVDVYVWCTPFFFVSV
jgi:hypothetical protein